MLFFEVTKVEIFCCWRSTGQIFIQSSKIHNIISTLKIIWIIQIKNLLIKLSIVILSPWFYIPHHSNNALYEGHSINKVKYCLRCWQKEVLFTDAPFSRESIVVGPFISQKTVKHDLLYWPLSSECFSLPKS